MNEMTIITVTEFYLFLCCHANIFFWNTLEYLSSVTGYSYEVDFR